MARYVKRGKSWQYELSYKDQEDGKFKKLRKSGFKTKSEAIAEAAEIESNLAKGFKLKPIKMSFPEYFEHFINTYKKGSIRENTLKGYMSNLKRVQELFDSTLVKDITRTDYQKLINIFSKNHAKDTVSNLNTQIRHSLQPLIDEGALQSDFTKNVVIKGKNIEKQTNDKFINLSQFKKLVEYFKNHLNPFYSSSTVLYIASITGMRLSEVLALTWEDIDFEKLIIHTHRTWDYRNKKENQDFLPMKTDSSNRFIIIDEVNAQILKQFQCKQNQILQNLNVQPPYNLVCWNIKNGIPNISSIQRSLKAALSACDIKENLSIHGLRHTHASILLYQGIDIMTVAKRLGHSSTLITQNVYAHIIKELEVRDSEKIRNIFQEI
ncbi:tyrosine-type recombinase/integrase [Lactococcus garvieae]|uniref:tyrosine-type recombinase/integrase n=1 Tax=Lactococcus garvieae TaxID=1363 RepID=UPI0013FDEFA2|nr:site-specific integrase [Lactococcus garvieae]NHI70094.1 site-specific integrase [Lactococcus garvieae]NHJ08080.1 site-specific integrase [Lactococcus garvieae]